MTNTTNKHTMYHIEKISLVGHLWAGGIGWTTRHVHRAFPTAEEAKDFIENPPRELCGDFDKLIGAVAYIESRREEDGGVWTRLDLYWGDELETLQEDLNQAITALED